MEDSRAEAAAKGQGKYLGKACQVCGCESRYTTNGNCVDCNARHAKAYQKRTSELLRKIKQQRASL
ncbi:hypothetical protein UFOVP919_2 [uncultured Caudovirales phage]|jgi:hypothetical protein|uniref:Uncharacterized protein n=1 Tax=uncultured Caudovirales phage TaxID=2100421 RepID=A0A6J5SKD5_9CAUD|nr:hypothetical protein UFOVP832_23 [uncultured Caudovirales phage]CAB4171206.1 hypothetical protein UFOVP919_2 [uncultured Caudovirales phage]CAB4214300.1 hypothetical protein UFOVP1453_28 [uncultured Caudovirales phage]